ncbi:condensation domain-containing protein [Pendulispora albinea]|uniref:Condensation domain-containing protein n=1 Tax=Pendulispora albinea TaxID=2741071 RepID=A0ABZ2MA46_9BACT
MTIPSTLTELLLTRASQQPHDGAYTFLTDGEEAEERLTYGELGRRARAIAGMLQRAGARGEPVLLLFAPGLDYVAAFLGCVCAGAIAVPAYPPDPSRLARTLPRLTALVADARARFALTTGLIRGLFEAMASAELLPVTWLTVEDAGEAEREAWRDPGAGPDDVAFLQYTSGSTGNPRGVILSHQNLLHNSTAIQRCFESNTESRGVIWLPPYHDMGLIGGVLQPLYGGFPVVLMSPLAFLTRPLRWLRAIARHRGTISGGPNFAYDLCVRKSTPEERAALDLRSWELAFNGAEPIHPETLERFAAAFEPSGFRREAFYPCYGLAEGTLIASGGRKGAGAVVREDGKSRLVGCGESIAGQELRVVDPERLVPVAGGEVGEIWLRGPSVARGYWRRDEETHASFGAVLPDDPRPYLRTGDLGFMADGELFVNGRIKDLVILRGRNLYPQDIERTAVACHPALRPGCAAAFSVAGDGEEQLVVVLEADPAKATDPAAILDRVRRQIAEQHEVQARAIVLLAPGAVPKTSSGKVQRRACRAQYLDGDFAALAESVLRPATASSAQGAPSGEAAVLRSGGTGAAPSGRTEVVPSGETGGAFSREMEVVPSGETGGALSREMEVVPSGETEVMPSREALLAVDGEARAAALLGPLRAWIAGVLGTAGDAIDVERPLTAYGLDSIMAVELAGRIHEQLGTPVPMALLLEDTGAARLAAHVAAALDGRAVDDVSAGAIDPNDVPLSLEQERLLFLEQLAGASAGYNIAVAVFLEGPLDRAALAQSLTTIVTRHAVLRVRYPRKNGRIVPILAPPGAPAALIFDDGAGASTGADASTRTGADASTRTDADAIEPEDAVLRRATEEARRPFDLERDPVLRARCYRAGPNKHLVTIVIHHVAADGWSMGILVRELSACYAAFASGRAPDLPPISVHYADFAAQQRRWLDSNALETALVYWKRQLAGAPALCELPADRARPPVRAFAGARHPFALGASDAASLQRLGATSGATLYMVLLAGFFALLHQRTGRDDLVVGTDVAGREHPEAQRLIGLFVNQLVLRANLAGDPTFRALVDRVRALSLEAYAHQRLPFGTLVEALRPPRDPSYNPLFQIMFVLENAPVPELALPDLRARTLELDDGGAPFDLSVLLTEHGGELRGVLRYDTALFDPATIAALGDDYAALLTAAGARPDLTLSELAGRVRAHSVRRREAAARAAQSSRLERFRNLRKV